MILYADTVTRSMREAMDETARRRAVQTQFNTDTAYASNIRK